MLHCDVIAPRWLYNTAERHHSSLSYPHNAASDISTPSWFPIAPSQCCLVTSQLPVPMRCCIMTSQTHCGITKLHCAISVPVYLAVSNCVVTMTHCGLTALLCHHSVPLSQHSASLCQHETVLWHHKYNMTSQCSTVVSQCCIIQTIMLNSSTPLYHPRAPKWWHNDTCYLKNGFRGVTIEQCICTVEYREVWHHNESCDHTHSAPF